MKCLCGKHDKVACFTSFNRECWANDSCCNKFYYNNNYFFKTSLENIYYLDLNNAEILQIYYDFEKNLNNYYKIIFKYDKIILAEEADNIINNFLENMLFI